MYSKINKYWLSKIISIFLIFILNINFLYADWSCKYTSQINKCIELNKTGSPLAEEWFLCISSQSTEKIAYNIILNDLFKKVDKEADKYLTDSEKAKNRFFGPEQKEPFPKWVDEIEKLFSKNWYYYNKYKNLVSSENPKWVIQETMKCLWWKSLNTEVKDYFFKSSTIEKIISDKNATRAKVAYGTMKLNKNAVRKDEKKKYVQKQRTHYTSVSDLFMVSMKYLIKILQKWPSKTKHPYKW